MLREVDTEVVQEVEQEGVVEVEEELEGQLLHRKGLWHQLILKRG